MKDYPDSYRKRDKIESFKDDLLHEIEGLKDKARDNLGYKDYADFILQLKEMVSDD